VIARKSGVLQHKSGDISETRKDRGNLAMETLTHQRSFERYHSRPLTASSSPRLGFATHPKLQSLLSHERVKLRTSNLAGTFTGSIGIKAHKKFDKKGAWAYPGTAQFLSTPYYLRNW